MDGKRIAVAAAVLAFAGCASKKAMRPTNGVKGDFGTDVANGDAWYIESKPSNEGLPYSCSFVEFDERGDYLDF